jgi:hypothetical protein
MEVACGGNREAGSHHARERWPGSLYRGGHISWAKSDKAAHRERCTGDPVAKRSRAVTKRVCGRRGRALGLTGDRRDRQSLAGSGAVQPDEFLREALFVVAGLAIVVVLLSRRGRRRDSGDEAGRRRDEEEGDGRRHQDEDEHDDRQRRRGEDQEEDRRGDY